MAEAIDIDFSSEVDIFISINMIYSGTGGSCFFILNNNQMPDRNDGEIFQNEKDERLSNVVDISSPLPLACLFINILTN